MILERAYAVLTVKAVDDGARTISGLASSPTPDRSGDVVDPFGAQFDPDGVPLLWMHNADEPVGRAVFGKPTAKGIPFTATIATFDEPPGLKARVDEAWQSVRSKLVRGVSIGFRALEYAYIDGGGVRYDKTEILELSLVSVPAQSAATIQTIKQFDTAAPAASGQRVVRIPRPGVTGTKAAGVVRLNPSTPPEGTMNIAAQIKSYTDARAVQTAVLETLAKASEESGQSYDAEQATQYDDAVAEIATIDKHLGRLNQTQALLAKSATKVDTGATGVTDPEAAAAAARQSRGSDGVTAVAKKLPPGVAFARLAGVIAHTKGNMGEASQYAREIFPNETPLHNVLKAMTRFRGDELIEKASVAAGNTTDATWAGPLVQYQDMVNDFIDWLRPGSIVGRMTGVRRVPFNIRVPRLTSGGSAAWVGEGASKPVTAFAFDNVTLRFTKLASICVITQELARFSSPSAELIIRDNLGGAINQQMDSDFIDPDNAGTTNVKPASITNGVTPVASTGNTEANVRQDINNLFAPYIAANLTPVNGVWIMTASTALALSLMVNALGQPAFPGITMAGGTFWGMPVIVSQAAGLVGSSAGDHIVVLANASDILLADDGQVTIDVSQEASVQMNSTPDNPATAATVYTSLWANNLVGLRAERYIQWVKARAQAVQYLSGVRWGQP